MMNFVNVFVNQSMMKESVAIVEPRVVTQHADQHVSKARVNVRQLSYVPGRTPSAPDSICQHHAGNSKNNLHEDKNKNKKSIKCDQMALER